MALNALPVYIINYIGLFIAFFYLLTFFEVKGKKKLPTLEKVPSYPPLTIIIPAYNEGKNIKRTIMAALLMKYGGKIEILVVDDGSTDDTVKVVKEIARRYKKVRLLSKPNGGKSDSINFGIKRVKSELIAVLDADTIPKRDALEKGVKYFQDEKVMAVTYRTVPSNRNTFFAKMQYTEYVLLSFFRILLTSMKALQIVPAFSIFRAKFFKKHGGFDVGNLTEDLEMGLRIKKYGYDVAYISDSYATTKVPEKFKDLKRQRVRWSYGLMQNLYKYRGLFGPRYGDLGVFFLPAIAVGVSMLIFIFFYALYNLFSLSSQQISKVVSVGIPTILGSPVNINLALTISDPRIILGVFGFLLATTMFFLAKAQLKEKLSFFNYVQYIFLYSWLLMYFYVITAIQFFIKKPSW